MKELVTILPAVRFEPGTAGWEAQTQPLSSAVPANLPSRLFFKSSFIVSKQRPLLKNKIFSIHSLSAKSSKRKKCDNFGEREKMNFLWNQIFVKISNLRGGSSCAKIISVLLLSLSLSCTPTHTHTHTHSELDTHTHAHTHFSTFFFFSR